MTTWNSKSGSSWVQYKNALSNSLDQMELILMMAILSWWLSIPGALYFPMTSISILIPELLSNTSES